MVKFLFVGDLHLRGTNPRNRIDDYKEAAKQKLKEVFKIAVDNAVDAWNCSHETTSRAGCRS